MCFRWTSWLLSCEIEITFWRRSVISCPPNLQQDSEYYIGNPYPICRLKGVTSIFLTRRATGHHLDTQNLKNHPSEHPNYFVRNFSKYQFQAYNWIFSQLNIVLWHCLRIAYLLSITRYIFMVEYVVVSLKNRTPQNFTIAIFLGTQSLNPY